MAIDLNKIREKLDKLSGVKKSGFSNIPVWKPTVVGEFRLRALPWPTNLTSDGTPFIERYFYYIPKQVLATAQFGEEDPVRNAIDMLFRSKKPDEKEIAKKLLPKMSAFLPVIVRGEEEKGVQLWRLNKVEYQRILSFFVNEDIGDILAIEDGFDLVITTTNSGKQYDGKSVLDKTIDPARKQSHLKGWFDNDLDKMNAALNNLPNVDEFLKFSKKTPSELQLILDKWLAGDESTDDTKVVDNDANEVTRGPTPKDDLEDLKTEIAKSKKSSTTKSKVVNEVPETPKASSKIDDAFADLIDED